MYRSAGTRVARVGRLLVGEGQPVRVMGIINVSPESFFPGSVKSTPEEAAEAAARMVEAGAEIIDVGGMSSAPYKEVWISEEVEAERLRSAIRAVRGAVSVPISADTFRFRPAEVALSEGAEMINDVRGLRHSAEIARLVKEYSASLIVMASDMSGDVDVMEGVLGQLRSSVETALNMGVEPERIIVDPGIGFHRRHAKKWYLVDGEILRRLGELQGLGYPICVGVSRKSFIGKVTGKEDPGERLYGSVAAEALAVLNGADLIRTHNPAESLDAVRVASLVLGRTTI
jgi:dihydropteroate synthase